MHSQQPQTLAFALADSPVGLLAWNAQLFDESLDADFVLANVAIYWFTGTAASAMRFYWEDAHATEQPDRADHRADRAGDVPGRLPVDPPVRRARPRATSSAGRRTSGPEGRGDVGGHYAAHEATDVLVDDIRQFFATLR